MPKKLFCILHPQKLVSSSVNQFLWSSLIKSKHGFRNNWHHIKRCSWHAHYVQMFTQHVSSRSHKISPVIYFGCWSVLILSYLRRQCSSIKVNFLIIAHAYESMLCLVPAFLFSPVYNVVYLGVWPVFTFYSAIKAAVDIYIYIFIYLFIYLFIHSFIHSFIRNVRLVAKRNHILRAVPFVFYVLRLTRCEFTRVRRSSAYNHQVRRTPQ